MDEKYKAKKRFAITCLIFLCVILVVVCLFIFQIIENDILAWAGEKFTSLCGEGYDYAFSIL